MQLFKNTAFKIVDVGDFLNMNKLDHWFSLVPKYRIQYVELIYFSVHDFFFPLSQAFKQSVIIEKKKKVYQVN